MTLLLQLCRAMRNGYVGYSGHEPPRNLAELISRLDPEFREYFFIDCHRLPHMFRHFGERHGHIGTHYQALEELVAGPDSDQLLRILDRAMTAIFEGGSRHVRLAFFCKYGKHR